MKKTKVHNNGREYNNSGIKNTNNGEKGNRRVKNKSHDLLKKLNSSQRIYKLQKRQL